MCMSPFLGPCKLICHLLWDGKKENKEINYIPCTEAKENRKEDNKMLIITT